MEENKPWRDLETFFPEPIYVGDIGWENFLKRWDSEVMELVEEILLRSGLEGDPNEYGLQARLAERNIALPIEVFAVRLPYPPRTETERTAAERRLKAMAESIPKIKQTIPSWPKVFEWEALLNDGLRYPRASAEAILAAERRLGTGLPSSYRNFLAVSNGWLTDQEIFLPVGHVGRLQDLDPGLVKDWSDGLASNIPDEKYFQYDLKKQYPIHLRVQYMPNCLLLSEHYGISSRWYFLNPAIIFEDGEWEAWSLESRIAGARRFRSFKAMMEWLYREAIAELRSELYQMD